LRNDASPLYRIPLDERDRQLSEEQDPDA